MTRTLTEDERALLGHVSRFGSDGYPVRRCGSRHWTWGPWRSVYGPRAVFPRKRDAVASFEAFLAVLREALGEERQHEALEAREARGVKRCRYCGDPMDVPGPADGDDYHAPCAPRADLPAQAAEGR